MEFVNKTEVLENEFKQNLTKTLFLNNCTLLTSEEIGG